MGYLGTALLFIGIYLIGQKRRLGFVLCFLGEIGWLIRGVQAGLVDLVVLSIIFAGLQLYNWWQWRPKSVLIVEEESHRTAYLKPKAKV